MEISAVRIKRLALWIVIILYTASLPEIVRVYEWIVRRFSGAFAARLPLIVVIILLAFFALYFVLAGKGARGMIHLFLCVCIAAVIFQIVELPNKRIHIPEYILMSWLLFSALKIDYRGKGGLLLVLVLSSLLGIVDEVEQGFHPERYYGYADMIVNSLSSAMGVLLLTGAGKRFPSKEPMGIKWRMHWPALLINAMGASGASLTCYHLGDVATRNTFFLSFPFFVVVLDMLASTGAMMVIFCSTVFPSFRKWYIPSSQHFAILWLFLPAAAFLITMGLTIVGYFLGLEFR